MIQAMLEHPDGPELEYASRTDVLLLLETSLDNLTDAAKVAGEAASENGYLEVSVSTPTGEHLGQVNLSEINGRFYVDSFAVAHEDGKTCPT